MPQFRGKEYNPNVFEKYQRTLESTKENSLIKNALFTEVNKYQNRLSEQAGGYFVTEPIKGRIGGEPVNLDGMTDIGNANERETYLQTKIAFGRANNWGEDDFVSALTGANFMPEAQEVKDYWDGELQKTVLSILKGISGITDNNFNTKHSYNIEGNLTADGCNRAAQKALGDKKGKMDVIFMHSVVSTNLEGLQLINFLKYTDKNGIERDLTIGTYNGKLVIVDDDMPVIEVAPTYASSADTTVDPTKTYYTRTGSSGSYTYTEVTNPTGNPSTSNYYEMIAGGYNEYTSYMLRKGFFEHEKLAVKTPNETVRDAKTRGGKEELITRERHIIVPTLISYTDVNKLSPENTDFENSSNWALANNGKTGSNKSFVDDKLIPFVSIKSRG